MKHGLFLCRFVRLAMICGIRVVCAALCLAAAAVAAAAPAAPTIRDTPAYELLSALDLLDLAPRKGLIVDAGNERPDKSRVVRISLTAKPGPDPSGARGMDLLRPELANLKTLALQSFDLFYNARDRLIAIFPVFPKDIAEREPQTREKWEAIAPKYLDLSPFYLDFQRPEDPGSYGKWEAFARQVRRDRGLIDTFIAERFRFLTAVYPDFLYRELPWRLHELDRATGDWEAFGFSPLVFKKELAQDEIVSDLEPGEFLRLFRASRPGKRRIVIPKFPSVYMLPTFTVDELEYMRSVYRNFTLGPESRVLVVGPGTGVDAWVASLRTKQPVYAIGINPLEIANTRATARLGGFRVRALVGNNIADEAGRPRFPGERFDAVFWSMPSYREEPWPARHKPSMVDFWDGDVGGLILKRFARSLPDVLKRDGRALLWNFAPEADGRNVVAEILKFAGRDKAVFHAEVRRFPKGASPKGEKCYKGHLYTVSFIQ